jgi:hypothetical protein
MRISLARAVALLLTFAAAAVAAQSNVPDPNAAVRYSAEIVAQLATDAKRIEELRAEATRNGAALQASCLDEQAKHAGANLATARQIEDGAALGKRDPEYAERSRQRLLLLSVYSMVYVDAAQRCAGVRELRDSVEVSVVRHTFDVPLPSGADPSRAPQIERPPLASPY